MSGESFLQRMRPLARLWRDRPPSGGFVLHRMPHDRWCPRRGPVTRYHGCPICEPKIFGKVLIARSAWIGKVPTGPATMTWGQA
jgi:hypothetical protein